MSDEREPDDTPVRADHVQKFLAWYGPLSSMSKENWALEWWTNALSNLTLGELRRGMKAIQRFSSKTALNPVQFWSLCKGKTDETHIRRFNALRAAARGKQA